MGTDIVKIVQTVLQQTLDLCEVPHVQMGRRYLRAFLAGEKYAEPLFKPEAVDTARLSMLTLATNALTAGPLPPEVNGRVAQIDLYVRQQKETR